MRAPRQLAHGILVALHERHWPAGRVPDVECAQDAVDATRRDDGIVVLVPVVCEDLGRRAAACHVWVDAGWCAAGGVDGDGGYEVVLCRGRGAEVVEAEVGVGGDGRDESWIGRAEGGAVCAVADW